MRCRGCTAGIRAGLTAVFFGAAAFALDGCASGPETVVECYYVSQSIQRSLPACETYILCVKPSEESRASAARRADVGSSSDSSVTRLDIYVQMPYARIHFERSADRFRGSYSVSFVFRDDDQAVVETKEVDRLLAARSYNETVSTRRDAFLQTFLLPPGKYNLELVVVDNGSGLRYRRRKDVEVRKFPGERFSASDYLFFENVQQDQKGISLTPLFPSGITLTHDSFGIFQELYHVARGDTIRLSLSYVCARQAGLEQAMRKLQYTPHRMATAQCIRPMDSTYYSSDSVFVAETGGTVQVLQQFPRPSRGVTLMTRRVYGLNRGTCDSSVIAVRIPVYAPLFPRLSSVDEEATALSYIARGDEIDSLNEEGDLPERYRRTSQFWRDHGGDVRRREFFERVREANELFSSCVEGWKTPMGITYIVCGPPDYVECQGMVSEVWYYDLGGNRGFVVPFRQSYENELGRYYEIVPFAVNDFLWQQFVDRWRRP